MSNHDYRSGVGDHRTPGTSTITSRVRERRRFLFQMWSALCVPFKVAGSRHSHRHPCQSAYLGERTDSPRFVDTFRRQYDVRMSTRGPASPLRQFLVRWRAGIGRSRTPWAIIAALVAVVAVSSIALASSTQNARPASASSTGSAVSRPTRTPSASRPSVSPVPSPSAPATTALGAASGASQSISASKKATGVANAPAPAPIVATPPAPPPAPLVIPTKPTYSTNSLASTCTNNVIQGTWEIDTQATDGGSVNGVRGYATGVPFDFENVGGTLWRGTFTVPNTAQASDGIVTYVDASIRDSAGGDVDYSMVAVTSNSTGCG